MSEQAYETALLSFMYCNAAGELTFRKDRVREHFDASDQLLRHPVTEPPPKSSLERPAEHVRRFFSLGLPSRGGLSLRPVRCSNGWQYLGEVGE